MRTSIWCSRGGALPAASGPASPEKLTSRRRRPPAGAGPAFAGKPPPRGAGPREVIPLLANPPPPRGARPPAPKARPQRRVGQQAKEDLVPQRLPIGPRQHPGDGAGDRRQVI